LLAGVSEDLFASMFRTVQENLKALLHVFEVLAVELMKIMALWGADF